MAKRQRRKNRRHGFKTFSEAALNRGTYTPHKPTLKELRERVHIPHFQTFKQMKDKEEQERRERYYDMPETRGVPKDFKGMSPAEIKQYLNNREEGMKGWWETVTSWPSIVLSNGKLTKIKMFWKEGRYILVKEDYIYRLIQLSIPYKTREDALAWFNRGIDRIYWEGTIAMEV